MTAYTTPEAGMRLAPCPFCGGPGRVTFGVYELDAGNHVVCEGRKDCPMFCSTPYRVHDTRAEAIAAWNTRAAAPVAPAGSDGEVSHMARQLYEASVLAKDALRSDFDRLNLKPDSLAGWWDSEAGLPLSGPGFVAYWTALSQCALAARAQPPVGEVVAWRYRYPNDPTWQLTLDEKQAHDKTGEVRALVDAHPAEPAARDGGEAEQVIADLNLAIRRMEHSDAGWACIDEMKAARDYLAASGEK